MRLFLIALQFITYIPVRIKPKEEEIARSSLFFPFVGGCIGLFLFFIFFLASRFFPHSVSILLVIIASIIITGGFHIEGFIDVCDGFYAGKNRDDILRIMKDPHCGSMGIIGAVILLLSKFIILDNIPSLQIFPALVLMGILSRWAMVFIAFSSKYARESGTGKIFIDGIKKTDFLLATIFTIVFSILLLGISGIFLVIISTCFIYLIRIFFNKKISGVTGDTLGATNEIIEVFSLLILLLFFK
ncbi:MAG: adenosylcobinamide-GDP ribazoletransferase [Candidatus Omnitrophica bacterium]|nr:adenosylcobinamide-GDP ribazoletransferase [Candidatus Omnitrophota bacterium]